MASSRKKKRSVGRVVLILILCLALIAVIAVTVGYSLVARRVKDLQAGAAFTFDYEATSTADSPALYTILQKTGSTKGTVSGLYAPDALQLSITAPGAVIPADPLTSNLNFLMLLFYFTTTVWTIFFTIYRYNP